MKTQPVMYLKLKLNEYILETQSPLMKQTPKQKISSKRSIAVITYDYFPCNDRPSDLWSVIYRWVYKYTYICVHMYNSSNLNLEIV